MVKLGVNIDHVATIRQARGGVEPVPAEAAVIAQKHGADGITVHLREDRRHIQDHDLYAVKAQIDIPLNLEMACDNDIIAIAKNIQPRMCTLVPEKRQELTTEGGLDVAGMFKTVKNSVAALKDSGILVSLFIEPDERQLDASIKSGADYIEIHTGRYAEYFSINDDMIEELERIKRAVKYAQTIGLKVNAGHGLNYINTKPITDIHGIEEVNIGHSIVARAVFYGLGRAVADMKRLISDK